MIVAIEDQSSVETAEYKPADKEYITGNKFDDKR